MNLEAIRDLLLLEPFQAVFERADADIPADRVNVTLDVENLSPPLQLQITRVPKASETDMEGVEMLHFFVPFPILVQNAFVPEVLRMLPLLNLATPIMAFNYHEEERFIYFRHVLLIPQDADVRRVIAETVWLIYFTLDNLGAEIAAIVTGRKTVAQVWHDVHD